MLPALLTRDEPTSTSRHEEVRLSRDIDSMVRVYARRVDAVNQALPSMTAKMFLFTLTLRLEKQYQFDQGGPLDESPWGKGKK